MAGERDGRRLAKLKHARIRASEDDIARALEGRWREEHLFALKQPMLLFDAYAHPLVKCDREMERLLKALCPADAERIPGPGRRTSKSKHAPYFDVRTWLFRLCRVDLTQINGINPTTARKVIAEAGPDLSRFKSAKHSAAWLGLGPGTKISGGKALSGASRRTANRAAQALLKAFSMHCTRKGVRDTEPKLAACPADGRRSPPWPSDHALTAALPLIWLVSGRM